MSHENGSYVQSNATSRTELEMVTPDTSYVAEYSLRLPRHHGSHGHHWAGNGELPQEGFVDAMEMTPRGVSRPQQDTASTECTGNDSAGNESVCSEDGLLRKEPGAGHGAGQGRPERLDSIPSSQSSPAHDKDNSDKSSGSVNVFDSPNYPTQPTTDYNTAGDKHRSSHPTLDVPASTSSTLTPSGSTRTCNSTTPLVPDPDPNTNHHHPSYSTLDDTSHLDRSTLQTTHVPKKSLTPEGAIAEEESSEGKDDSKDKEQPAKDSEEQEEQVSLGLLSRIKVHSSI